MTDNPLVSVIIPIYKVESYLRECVDSVINQTYKNLEIILVDDGSPDNCPKICDEYALQDSRIKVIHKANGGLSDARNAGMKIATADYWSFVDSDDVCHPQMIEILMKPILKNSNIKLSCSDFDTIYDDSIPSLSNQIFDKFIVYDTVNYFIKKWTPQTWMKIYHKDVFNNVSFPIGRYHEDTFTTYKLQYKAPKIACTEAKLYFYRKRKDSIMTTPNRKRVIDLRDASVECIHFFADKESIIYSKFLVNSATLYCLTQLKGNEFYCENCDDILQKWKKELLHFPISKLNFTNAIRFIYAIRLTKIKIFIGVIKMKLKIWFPFLNEIKKKFKLCLKFQS